MHTLHLVMFDIDGTLVDSTGIEDRCFVRAAQETLGIEDVDSDWSTYRNVTDGGCAREIVERARGREATGEEVAAIRRRHVELLAGEAARDPSQMWATRGAPELLEVLRARDDVALAIATGAWGDSAKIKLATARLPVDGLPVVSSDISIVRLDIMRAAEGAARQRYRVDGFASRTYVGDGVWDLRGARSLGYSFLGVGRGERAERLRREGAAQVLEDFARTAAVVAALGL
jgi:phosphoglycolate phosphatase-like HAD superfamily hydrolase